MPFNYGNYEVQRLMRDVGTSVAMNYGCEGSSAYSSDVANALKTSFGFSSANYDDFNSQRMKYNINAQQPVILSGYNSENGHHFIIDWYYSYFDGHAWVCDGSREYNYTICDNGQYQGGGSYLYFHMNWGWHEYNIPSDYIGWFAFNNWTITGPNFSYNFQYSNSITSEIHP